MSQSRFGKETRVGANHLRVWISEREQLRTVVYTIGTINGDGAVLVNICRHIFPVAKLALFPLIEYHSRDTATTMLLMITAERNANEDQVIANVWKDCTTHIRESGSEAHMLGGSMQNDIKEDDTYTRAVFSEKADIDSARARCLYMALQSLAATRYMLSFHLTGC